MDSSKRLNIPSHGRKLVDWISMKPWQALLVGFVLLLAMIPGYRWFSVDFSYMTWFFEGDPAVQEYRTFEDFFGNDETILIALHSPDGIFDKESATLVSELTEAMWKLPEVIRVDSLANFDWTHSVDQEMVVEPLLPSPEELTDELLAQRKAIALNHEILPGYLIGADGKTAMLIARLRPTYDGKIIDNPLLVESAYKLVEKYQRDGHSLHVSGQPAWDVENGTVAFKDLETILPLAGLLSMLLLMYFIGSFSGIVLSFVVASATIVAAMAIPGLLGFSHGPMTLATPQMLLALGLANAIHLLSVFYGAMRRGMDQKNAAIFSLEKNYAPTLLTTASTAIGFFSCCLSDIRQVFYMGIIAGTGVIIAWLFSYFILAPLMFIVPSKIKPQSAEKNQAKTQFAHSVAHWIIVRRKPIMWFSLLISVVAVMIASKNTINANPVLFYKEDKQLRIDYEFMTENIGGMRAVEFLVKTGKEDGIKDQALLTKVETLQNDLLALPYVTSATSIVDILKSTNRALMDGDESEYKLPDNKEAIAQELLLYTMSLPQGSSIDDRVSLNRDALRITVLMTLVQTKESIIAVDDMIERAEALGLDVVVTGKTVMFDRVAIYTGETFILSFVVAASLISLLLMFVFKSWKLGLLSLLPNVIPIAVGGAVLYLIGFKLDPPMCIVISLCLGVAVDDTIHILANYRRLMTEGYNAEDAIAEIFEKTLPALITTTSILVVVFGSFIVASFVPNANFGFITAVVLAFALVFDLFFLPAMLSFSRIGSIVSVSTKEDIDSEQANAKLST